MNTIQEITRKLSINWIKIGLMFVFQRKAAIYEYFLDKANTAVNIALENISSNSTISTVIIPAILTFARAMKNYVEDLPEDWRKYALDCNECLLAIHDAFKNDKKVDTEEFKRIMSAFTSAYSRYKAD